MVIGDKRYCDECNSDDAQRFYEDGGLVIRDLCEECANRHILTL